MLREQFHPVCQNDLTVYVVEAQRHSSLLIVKKIFILHHHMIRRTFCHIRFHVSRYNGIDADFVTSILSSQSASETQYSRFRCCVCNGPVTTLQAQQRADIDNDWDISIFLSPASQVAVPVQKSIWSAHIHVNKGASIRIYTAIEWVAVP